MTPRRGEERQLLKGNVALAKGALAAGCRFYFGYPITPQNDIPEFLSAELPKVGGVFVQVESEIAAINMVLGASASGARAMTSSSGPGISLMQEGMSYMAGGELPSVVVNVMRCGPGLGGIMPAQGDYFQATRGGGHGDYRNVVLAPASVSEMYHLTIRAFELADKYRNPAMILADALLGQMMEPVALPVEPTVRKFPKPWVITGAAGRTPRVIKSLYLEDGALEAHNLRLQAKYDEMTRTEVMVETTGIEEAELVVVAFGSCARIAKTAVKLANQEDIRAGLLRPITLFPFPTDAISELALSVKKMLVVEMNLGQMLEDVKLAVAGNADVFFYGRPGGGVPTQEEILLKIREVHCAESFLETEISHQ